MKRKIAIEIISFLLIVLFVYAALNKVLDYQKFTIQIGQSPLLTGFGETIPWLVIVLEIIVAVILAIPKLRLVALFGSFSLMVAFTAYIIAILNFTDYVPCSCGGVLEKLGWKEHLLFNIGFVILSFVGIVLQTAEIKTQEDNALRKFLLKKVWILIGCCFAGSAATVAFLIVVSGEMRDNRNSFLRLFPSHPVVENRAFDIRSNAYYLAGGTGHQTYLGNYLHPLQMLTLYHVSGDTQHVKLRAAGVFDQKFWALRVQVDSPYFYLFDGAVPRIYAGSVGDWKAERFAYDSEYFLELVSGNLGSFFIKSLSNKSNESVLGKITVGSPHFVFNEGLLQKQIDGVFCTDGMMHFDRETSRFIYLYRYRNQYFTTDTLLNLLHSGHTIDTISKAKIKVATISSTGAHTMAAPPLVVNKRSTVYKHWLFVNSNLSAQNEHPDASNQAEVVDVYDLRSSQYQFSFYLFKYEGKEDVREFIISGNQLVVLFDTHLQLFDLNPRYFSADTSPR